MIPEIIDFKEITDGRGGLIALEELKNIPFAIKRIYYIYNTPANIRRGYHAHKKLQQIAVCVKGSCSFLLDDGREKTSIRLDSPKKGLFIRSMTWREMYDFTEDCLLMVLADEYYDEEDYIRNYEEFIRSAKIENS